MLPFLSFACNGLLVGVMVAFSSDHLSRIVIPLLFAVFGGSIAAFGKGLTDDRRREAYLGLLSLSLFCTVGIVLGVLAVQHRWLSLTDGVADSTQSAEPYPYLRADKLDGYMQAIQMQVNQGQLPKDKAYDDLIKFLADVKK